MNTVTAIKGFKDILPEDIPWWRKIETTARELARRYDFQELRLPLIERTELYARGIGEATDIVEKEMYTITDKSGDKITLRPEATAGMVRAVLEHNLAEGGRPVKLFCLGPMFRYENTQKGRQRQFHQLDLEIFGDPGPQIDAELLAWLCDFLSALGLSELSITLNSLGCPECRPAFREALVAFLTTRQAELCLDCRRRLALNPLRIIDCKAEGCRRVVAEAPAITDGLCGDCRDHFAVLKGLLDELDLRYQVDPRLVRGLDYYTRTAFEIHSRALGAQNAVAGGGRYDGLSQALGGTAIPGIGFAVGLERLVMLLKKSAAEIPASGKLDYYLAVLDPAGLTPGLALAQKLRRRGLAVAADWEVGSLKSRLKRADKAGAQKVAMLGTDELAGGLVTVRDLTTREQRQLPLGAPELF